MRISEKMGLNKSRLELDFFDYEIDKDTYMFFDPYYIARKEDIFLKNCNEYLETFFNRFLFLLKRNENAAHELFIHLGEVNEICLGMSKGKPAGKGIGRINAERIFEAIKSSNAFQEEVAENLEDIRLFIDGIDKDKVSDMVANIIRLPLIDYTEQQCRLHNIQLTQSETGFYWDKQDWVRGHRDMLVLGDKTYLLFPRNLVTNSKYYSASTYFKTYILNFYQQKNLEEDTALVRKTYKNGIVIKSRVYKKDIEKDFEAKGVVITKDWIARFTKENPEVFEKFRKETINKIVADNSRALEQEEIDNIIDVLINELSQIELGEKDATRYHHLISGILQLLFYPQIAHPRIEEEIHDGRKRIDIAFDNIAEKGFFFRLGTLYNVPCSMIMVECKNYSKDIANPELDQMAGRFSAVRGQFGIICCRSLDNKDLFLKKERDTVYDRRGWIIHLTDEDIKNLLINLKNGISFDDYLVQKFSDINNK